ncbi:hypothetical protein UM590_01245 [Staphylococcus aureus]|nr:hypothetical protein UM630_08020 [Staphylococcus aureus]WRN74936.1 hypothetical protein UM590_01245 [Staphylococcus aureus]
MNPKQYFQSIHKYDLRENHYKQRLTVIGNQTFIRAIKRDDKKYLISNVISFIWHLILKNKYAVTNKNSCDRERKRAT